MGVGAEEVMCSRVGFLLGAERASKGDLAVVGSEKVKDLYKKL